VRSVAVSFTVWTRLGITTPVCASPATGGSHRALKCCLAIEVEKLRTISSVEKLDYTPVLSWQLAGFEEPAAGWEAVLTDGAPEAAAEEEDEASDSEVVVDGAEPPPSDEAELRLRAAPPDVTGPASTTGKEALCTWRGQPECGATNNADGALDACNQCRFYFHHKCAIRNGCQANTMFGRCDELSNERAARLLL
jgi:hypothetical protein